MILRAVPGSGTGSVGETIPSNNGTGVIPSSSSMDNLIPFVNGVIYLHLRSWADALGARSESPTCSTCRECELVQCNNCRDIR